MDVGCVSSLFVGEGFKSLQDFAKPKNTIERCSQLMTHVGKKLTFKPIRFEKLQVNPCQLVDAQILFDIHGLKLFLGFGHVPKHSIKRFGQFVEFIFGID